MLTCMCSGIGWSNVYISMPYKGRVYTIPSQFCYLYIRQPCQPCDSESVVVLYTSRPWPGDIENFLNALCSKPWKISPSMVARKL